MAEQSMIERVARAMARANYPAASDNDIDEMWEGWVMEARAAIAAMREPTPAMVKDGEACDGTISAKEIWQTMIDAALQERG